MRLFAYKMTHDTGFAPNPFWGFLTLATCKPWLRRSKRVGDWIAGFTSKQLCGDEPGDERLVFLMQVGERIALADYYRDRRFQSRIPRESAATRIHRCGDNIYMPLVRHASDPQDFVQLPNGFHGPSEKVSDLNGRNALIATRFAYFGGKAPRIPRNVRPELPPGQSAHGTQTHDLVKARHFIDHVFEIASAGVMADPHQWPSKNNCLRTHDANAPNRTHAGVEEKSEGSDRPSPSTSGTTCG